MLDECICMCATELMRAFRNTVGVCQTLALKESKEFRHPFILLSLIKALETQKWLTVHF